MEFDSDIFQSLISDGGCGEQYKEWLSHQGLELEDWLTDDDEGFDKFDFNHYHPGFLDFVMSQVAPKTFEVEEV